MSPLPPRSSGGATGLNGYWQSDLERGGGLLPPSLMAGERRLSLKVMLEANDEEVGLLQVVGDTNMCCIGQEGVDVVVQHVVVVWRSEVALSMLICQVAEVTAGLCECHPICLRRLLSHPCILVLCYIS